MFLVKTRLPDTTLNSYQNLSSDWGQPENVTPSEFKALKNLGKSKNTKQKVFLYKCDWESYWWQ